MPRLYFDPGSLRDLAAVFGEAKAALRTRGQDSTWEIEQTAKRILLLAAAGIPPQDILIDVIRSPQSAHKKRRRARQKARSASGRKARAGTSGCARGNKTPHRISSRGTTALKRPNLPR
jgi:hypothetical protein